MSKRRARMTFLTKFVILVWMCLVICTITGVISIFFPFAPSQGFSEFCEYLLPIICFPLLMGPMIWGRIFQSNRYNLPPATRRWWLTLIFGGVYFSYAWALMIEFSAAIPTRYISSKQVDTHVTIDDITGLIYTYDNWTWITFRHGGSTSKFMWERSDPVMNGLRRGDCIGLHGREWPLGLYVDSITRSNACHSENAKEPKSNSAAAASVP